MKSEITISVKEARKILGKEAKWFTDNDIETELNTMSAIAGLLIKELPKTSLLTQLKKNKLL